VIIMPEQLTIFDLEKAHIKGFNSMVHYTNIFVYILNEAKEIDELPIAIAPDERLELLEYESINVYRIRDWIG